MKSGDTVLRIGESFGGALKGHTYIVEEASKGTLTLKNQDYRYESSKFKVLEYVNDIDKAINDIVRTVKGGE